MSFVSQSIVPAKIPRTRRNSVSNRSLPAVLQFMLNLPRTIANAKVAACTPNRTIMGRSSLGVFLAALTWTAALVVDSLALRATEPEKLPTAEKVDLADVAGWLATLTPAAQRGYRHLVDSVYLPADLDDEVADELESRLENGQFAARQDQGANAGVGLASDQDDAHSRRLALFRHYGLTPRPDQPQDGKPLQYVVDPQSKWVMNCFACHGGSVYGTPMPGAPNNSYQLQSFVEDIRSAKLKLGKPLGHMEIGSMFMPLGSTTGSTNAVMFGVALMHFRDADLNVLPPTTSPPMVHHDMDPPAWWLLHRKQRIYADGFAQKGHRGLMQFMLVRENGPEKFRAWENDFRDVLAFIESLRPPKYPGPVDAALAGRGQQLFRDHCSRCHGTYQPDPVSYPQRLIPIDEVGTDRVRLEALSEKHRAGYGKSWFAHYGEQETWDSPDGYMAPPLDGVWASPPYFHNGSVPTLWHVLNPEHRPVVWRRVAEELDENRVGMQVEELTEVPRGLSAHQKRHYFDTRRFGKSAQGHDFPLELNAEERTAVLEYLKTL